MEVNLYFVEFCIVVNFTDMSEFGKSALSFSLLYCNCQFSHDGLHFNGAFEKCNYTDLYNFLLTVIKNLPISQFLLDLGCCGIICRLQS